MTAMTIEVLPAAYGDCLWVECLRAGGREPWRMLIDGGTPDCWPELRKRIDAQAERGPVHFDLVVVSHIDSDHIGGLLPLLNGGHDAVTFEDIWFNGLPQLPALSDKARRGVPEGEDMVELLSSRQGGAPLPWNERFHRSAVVTAGDGAFETVDFDDGPTLTLLSPTPRRLARLREFWDRDLGRVRRGESSEPPCDPGNLPLTKLDELAAIETSRDRSAANGSSIAFLLEHAGTSCLFAADAFSSVLGTAITSVANARDGQPVEVDAFKLPHHGSKGNVTLDLLRVAPARHYLVSTNGLRFGHPHDIALARVVAASQCKPTLWFNYATGNALRWSDPDLPEGGRFKTELPTAASGTTLRLPVTQRIDAA